MKTKIAIIFAAMLTVFGVILPVPAQAHTWTTYYPNRWVAARGIGYGMHTGFPGGAYRSIHLNGKDQWNNNGDSTAPKFFWSLRDDINYGNPALPCTRALYTGALYWRDLDYLGTGVLGATRTCASSGNISRFTIEFDSDRNWYVGTGDAPRGRPDWWSVVTHEFGHATGWRGHYLESDAACPNSGSRETMCPSIYLGTERQRTLGPHDIHTFKGAY